MNSVDISKITTQELNSQLFADHGVNVAVLRADLLHPVISGNKWFKLKYNLIEAKRMGRKGIASFGGAYSNHLVALACLCKQEGLSSLGIIRGEEPATYSATLKQLSDYDMQLHFVSREAYNDKKGLVSAFDQSSTDYYWVDEGGKGENGIKGASEMLDFAALNHFTHIMCAVGTGTMIKGLLHSARNDQRIIGIPVLKVADPKNNELRQYISESNEHSNFELLFDYHEGGYAHKTGRLLSFMNQLYTQHGVPTDFVYTGKLFKAAFALIEAGYFRRGSSLLLIHSGGLQGNRSLPPGSLLFAS